VILAIIKNNNMLKDFFKTLVQAPKRVSDWLDEMSTVTYIQPESQTASVSQSNTVDLPDYVPEEYRKNIIENATEYNLPPVQLAAQIMTENRHWNASFINEDEGAVGLGQHRDIFYKDMNPRFKKKYGRDYDRLNPEDNIKATAMGLRHYVDLADGDMEMGLASYNAGRSNALQMEKPSEFSYNKTVRHFMESSDEPNF